MTKKNYQKRLPTVLPPAPRRAPAAESLTTTHDARPRPSTSLPPSAPAPTQVPSPAPDPVAGQQEPRSTPSGPARVMISLAVVLGVVAALVAVWQITGDEQRDPPSAAPVPAGWPEAGATRTVTEVGPSGVLEVTHWIHTTETLDELEVALPELPDGVSIEASQVEVVADGQRASGPGALTFDRASYVFPDATRIRVTYQLAGAVELSTSAPGRGLVTVTALDVSATQGRDTRVVRAEAVLSLACAASAQTSLEPCGESDATDQWRVQLTGSEVGDRVVAAVTVSS